MIGFTVQIESTPGEPWYTARVNDGKRVWTGEAGDPLRATKRAFVKRAREMHHESKYHTSVDA